MADAVPAPRVLLVAVDDTEASGVRGAAGGDMARDTEPRVHAPPQPPSTRGLPPAARTVLLSAAWAQESPHVGVAGSGGRAERRQREGGCEGAR